MPSKFLIHRARVAHVVRTSARFGVLAGQPKVDLRRIVEESVVIWTSTEPRRGRARNVRRA